MRAARYYGPGDVRVENIPEPQAKQGQIKLKVAWNGICGSDLHAYLMELPIVPTKEKPNIITGETLPITLGHEISGTIAELGPGVDGNKFKVGQNAIINPALSCMKIGTCEPCTIGTRNVCPHSNFKGMAGGGGGLAEYVTASQEDIYVLPDGVPLDVGAILEPMSVAWHAVKRSNFKPGNTTLVLGAGPIGICVLKALKALDPSATVIISEPAAARREITLRHGATIALDPLQTNVPAAVLEATGGKGVDIAYDAAGIQASIDTALFSVKPRGMIMNVAVWEKTPQVDFNAMLFREITITGIFGYDRVHAEVVEAAGQGKFPNLVDLVTSRVSLEDVVEKGIKALINDKDNQIKILIHP